MHERNGAGQRRGHIGFLLSSIHTKKLDASMVGIVVMEFGR